MRRADRVGGGLDVKQPMTIGILIGIFSGTVSGLKKALRQFRIRHLRSEQLLHQSQGRSDMRGGIRCAGDILIPSTRAGRPDEISPGIMPAGGRKAERFGLPAFVAVGTDTTLSVNGGDNQNTAGKLIKENRQSSRQ